MEDVAAVANTTTTAPDIPLEAYPSSHLFLAYGALIVMAMVPIYIGSLLSLNPFDSNGERKGETVKSSDAKMFPIMGSVMLLSLFLLFKFFPKKWVNIVLLLYFVSLGIFAISSTFGYALNKLFPRLSGYAKHHYEIKLPYFDEPLVLDFTSTDYVALPLSIGLVLWYTLSKHWILNNAVALSFAIQGIDLIHLSSFKVGSIMLGGLFFYDIFWVFGTPVMVTVAKSFDAPIKLLFPRSLFIAGSKMSLLGLGDIVIPGVLIAMLLRFDEHQKPRSRVYFWSVLVAYFLAVVCAMVVMHTFQAAQPVLLYIVPLCLGTPLAVAAVRGELRALLAYTEDSEKEEEEKKQEKKSE